MDERGLLAYRFPMPHTFALEPPWHSALAQGEAVSFLLRAAQVLERPELVELAERAAESLLDPGSALVATTSEGPVLQEYPTDPPAHVLNGWLFALWGLYDLAHHPGAESATAARAAAAIRIRGRRARGPNRPLSHAGRLVAVRPLSHPLPMSPAPSTTGCTSRSCADSTSSWRTRGSDGRGGVGTRSNRAAATLARARAQGRLPRRAAKVAPRPANPFVKVLQTRLSGGQHARSNAR